MLIARKTFRQQVGHTLITFEAGRVIQDEVLEALLLRTGAPVDVVAAAADLVHCPHCKRTFTIKQAVAAGPKTEPSRLELT